MCDHVAKASIFRSLIKPWLPNSKLSTRSLTCLHCHPKYQLSPNFPILSAQMSPSSFPPPSSISHHCSFAEAGGTSAEQHGLMTHHTDNDRPGAQLQSQHLNPPELAVPLRTTANSEVAHPVLSCNGTVAAAAACSFYNLTK